MKLPKPKDFKDIDDLVDKLEDEFEDLKYKIHKIEKELKK